MNKTFLQSNLFKSLTIHNRKIVGKFNKSTSAAETEEVGKFNKSTSAAETEEDGNDSSPAVLFDDDDIELKEEIIANNRNKSRLLPQHRNMLMDTVPYDESQSWIHNTVKYKRMMFGRYGLASGVDPRLCFYSNKERADIKEYEKVAFPFTLQEMVKDNERIKIEKEQNIQKREDDIEKKLGKLDTWTRELQAKIAKKEADANAAKQRKERLIEEVRRQFGFKLDTRDERFKELLAQKEKDDKKKQKEERRKLKEEKMLAKLQEKINVEEKPTS